MGKFPVAVGCWTERMVRREGGGLGSKNGSSVKEEDRRGELQVREKEGRVSRAHGVAPTLWGRVDVWRGSSRTRCPRLAPRVCSAATRGRRSRVQTTREQFRWAAESQVLALATNAGDDDAQTLSFWRIVATPG